MQMDDLLSDSPVVQVSSRLIPWDPSSVVRKMLREIGQERSMATTLREVQSVQENSSMEDQQDHFLNLLQAQKEQSSL